MTSPELPAGLKPAPLVKRFFAFFIDMVIVLSMVFTVWIIFWILVSLFVAIIQPLFAVMMGDSMSKKVLSSILHYVWILLLIVLPLGVYGFYHARLDSSVLQGTIGKMLLGLQVSDEAENRLTFKAAWWRAFNKLAFGAGFFVARRNPKQQTLHDKLSKTLVVKK